MLLHFRLPCIKQNFQLLRVRTRLCCLPEPCAWCVSLCVCVCVRVCVRVSLRVSLRVCALAREAPVNSLPLLLPACTQQPRLLFDNCIMSAFSPSYRLRKDRARSMRLDLFRKNYTLATSGQLFKAT